MPLPFFKSSSANDAATEHTNQLKKMNIAQYKLDIIEKILPLDDEELLGKIYNFIQTLLDDSEGIAFSTWCEQFSDYRDINEFIPAYGKTVHDYRYELYEAERYQTMSPELLQQKIDQLHKDGQMDQS